MDVHGIAGRVCRERRDAELTGQAEDVVLGRADELSAGLDDLAVAEIVVQGATPHAVPRLEDDHAASRCRQGPGRGEPGEAGADHDNINPAWHHSATAVGLVEAKARTDSRL
jgi:hypothetical protein